MKIYFSFKKYSISLFQHLKEKMNSMMINNRIFTCDIDISRYCCYSKCSAEANSDSSRYSGYGSVMLIFSKFVEISYSSTLDCPSEGKSYGAQIDLKSNSSIASNINLTNGNAEYCCGIEYRDS